MNWLLRGLLHHVYMAEDNGGASGGGAAATGADSTAAGTQTNAGSAESNESAANVLASASGESAQAAQVQEKYLVKNEDGSVNWEATATKQAQGYGELSKRLGSGDVAPKTVEDYQITVPDALKGAWNPKEDAEFSGFLKEAHAAGYTQKQIDLAVSEYTKAVSNLAGGFQQLSADDCVADLKQGWKTEAEYTAGVSNAYKAAQGFFGDDAEHIIKNYGNDPKLIRGLAKMGAEMGEDKSLSPTDTLPSGTSIDELMAHPAYSDPKHPEHARVSKQVQSYFAAQARQQEKAGNAPLL